MINLHLQNKYFILSQGCILKHKNKNIFIRLDAEKDKFIVFYSDTNQILFKDKINIYKYEPITKGTNIHSTPNQYEEIIKKFNTIHINLDKINYIINNISPVTLESTIKLLEETNKV